MASTSDIEQLFSTMLQLGKLMSHRTQETREEKASTMLQFSALQFLKEQPNGTVTDLGTQLKLSKSSATQLVERLAKLGFIERIDDKDDRRIVRLIITHSGEKEFSALKEKIMEKMKRIFFHIPAQDIRELIRIHTNLIETLKKDQQK
jgi:DNA-binding MarR family transcriptional regulator